MASTSFMPSLFEMVKIRSNGMGVPILFPVGEDGLATITALHISIRFGLQDTSLWVEREVYDPHTSVLSHTVPEVSKHSDDGSIIWTLKLGKYRVYGLTSSQMSIPTQLVTPCQSSTCTMTPPPTVRVKIEPRVQAIIDLSESSKDDTFHAPPPLVNPILEAQPPLHAPLFPLCTPALEFLRASSLVQSQCIVQSLRKLTQMPGCKNILKRLDYDKIKTMDVEFLPPTYDGDVLFVLPAMGSSSLHSKAKSMFGMDKRYDGHIWTKTVTTNISNVLDLSFWSSSCVGHLRCENPHCEYLGHAHRTSSNNDTEFEGVTKEPFSVGGPLPSGSTLVCKICKMPPKCVALCSARIFYVHGDDTSQRACIHLGHHSHPVKVGDYRESRKKIDALIEKHVERTPQATVSKIVMEVSKDLLGEYLIRDENDPPTVLSLNKLEPVFDSCKELNSPSLRNRVYTFKYLRRFGVMDGITKLRGLSNWAYIQRNMFPGQGDDFDKVFIFKMSEVGPGSGVDLVRRMQPNGDLEHAWIMFDHIKRVTNWTTMACHVYDATYQRVMTIACCDFQSEDKDAQIIFWKNLNHVMARHGVPLPQFQGFMADSAQAN